MSESHEADHPHVSFVVPAYQAARTLAATVASVRAAAPPSSELVIVDDGSFDDTVEVARTLGDVVVARPCQGGAARARNDGARVARGDLLVFVDADVTVTPEAVAGAIRHLEDGADAVFGAYRALPPAEVANVATSYKNVLHHYTHLVSAGEVSTFWSGFGAVRREAFDAVEGFDPAVTSGADVEDIHLGYRLRAAGYRIVLDPALQVSHHKRYTVRGIISSDLFHRAVPWTRAMLHERTFNTDLNLRSSALGSTVLAWATLLSPLGALAFGPWALLAVPALLVGWVVLNLPFLRYVAEAWDLRGAVASGALLFLYYIYGPLGAFLGVWHHLLRRRDDTPRHDLATLAALPRRELDVTVAVVAQPGDPLDALDGLPAVDPRWELLVVAETPPPDLPDGARFLAAPAGAGRPEMRQLALEASAGEMFAVLDAPAVPAPGWLDRVDRAARGHDLVVAGSFGGHQRGTARASQVLRLWQWRPERRARWLIEHPPWNLAYRSEVALHFGGLAHEGLAHALTGFGVRPVRFDPAMSVEVPTAVTVGRFLRDALRGSRAWVGDLVRTRRHPWMARLALLVVAPLLAVAAFARRVAGSIRDGTADAGLWRCLPLVALGCVASLLGSLLGIFRPSPRSHPSAPRTTTGPTWAAFPHHRLTDDPPPPRRPPPDGAGGPRRHHRSVWAVAATAVLLATLAAGLRLTTHEGGAGAFIVAGDLITDPATVAGGIHVERDAPGYDGQFVYRLALDPLTTRRLDHGILLDTPTYRQQRIVLPVLAWLVSGGGNPTAVTWALIGLNVLATGALAAIGARLARDHRRTPWWGLALALAPGFAVTLAADLNELVAMAFATGGLLAVRRRHWSAAALFTLAVLTRETTLLIPIGLGVAWVIEHRPGSRRREVPMAAFVVPGIVLVAWQRFLQGRWDADAPAESGASFNLAGPFRGLVDGVGDNLRADTTTGRINVVLTVAVLAFLLGAVIALRRSEVPFHEKVAFVVALVAASLYSWHVHEGFLRAVIELWCLAVIVLLGRRDRRSDATLVAGIGVWAAVAAAYGLAL